MMSIVTGNSSNQNEPEQSAKGNIAMNHLNIDEPIT
jgi:hypothetical protein